MRQISSLLAVVISRVIRDFLETLDHRDREVMVSQDQR